MKEVVIVAVQRTPIGSFLGSLSSLTATQLAAEAIKAALKKSGLEPRLVQEVFLGNVLSAGMGQAPARQAAIFAGLPHEVVCTTVNKVCASGSKAIMLAAQAIQLGQIDIAIAGGMESMSNVPYYLDKGRNGYKLGHGQLVDGLIKDGLWDVYNDYHMGSAAELTASEFGISRKMQDDYAIQSYQRAAKAYEQNKFDQELCEIEIKGKSGATFITQDEEYKNVNFAKIPDLKPVFQKDGTITAANASTLNDGAAALILMSLDKAKELNIKPLAKILSYADAAQEPAKFTTSPALALPKALKNAGLNANSIDYFEINEAFSVVSIANNMLLNLDPDKVNIYGGAVALGHPLGSSGARIACTLVNVLKNENASIGALAICNGGGGASSIIIENL